MPVSPRRQAQLRALRRDEKQYPLKRCKNCPKFFRKTTYNRTFCSTDCKKEFEKWGAAYGPLKEHFEKMVSQRMKQYADSIEARLRMLEGNPNE